MALADCRALLNGVHRVHGSRDGRVLAVGRGVGWVRSGAGCSPRASSSGCLCAGRFIHARREPGGAFVPACGWCLRERR